VAGQRILDEETTSLVDEGYEESGLPERSKALLAYMDVFLHHPASLPDDVRERLRAEFTDEEILECTLYAAVASGFSRMLIVLGGEPQEMTTTVAPVEMFSR
jgi:alkylhydroperoxidase family enzyme